MAMDRSYMNKHKSKFITCTDKYHNNCSTPVSLPKTINYDLRKMSVKPNEEKILKLTHVNNEFYNRTNDDKLLCNQTNNEDRNPEHEIPEFDLYDVSDIFIKMDSPYFQSINLAM